MAGLRQDGEAAHLVALREALVDVAAAATCDFDAIAGRLSTPQRTPRALMRSVRRSHSGLVDATGLDRILSRERARGQASGRPAVKFATVEDLRRASRQR